MKYLNTLFLLILCSCGKTPYVDPEFIEYLQRFEKEVGYSSKNITTIFADLEGSIIGRCSVDGFFYRTIEIDKEFWINSDEDSREQLMYHELGHCAMLLNHNDTFVYYHGMEVPGSIMNSYFFGEMYVYRDNKDAYKKALSEKTVVNF